MAIVSVETQRTWAGLSPTDASQDAALAVTLAGAVRRVEAEANRRLDSPPVQIDYFTRERRAGIRSPRGRPKTTQELIRLPYAPTDPNIIINYFNGSTYDPQDLAAFDVRGRTVELLEGYLPTARRSVRIDYQVGYAEAGEVGEAPGYIVAPLEAAFKLAHGGGRVITRVESEDATLWFSATEQESRVVSLIEAITESRI